MNRGKVKRFARLTGPSRPFMAGLPLQHPGRGSGGMDGAGLGPWGALPVSRRLLTLSYSIDFFIKPLSKCFFSPTLQWKQRRSPPLLRSSCSTLWSDPIYKCDRRRSNSLRFPGVSFFIPRNKFRMSGGRKKKKENYEGCRVCSPRLRENARSSEHESVLFGAENLKCAKITCTAAK